ncbi:AAA family ATPase [Nocardia sp. NPDC057455]|uniref:phosphatase domain-containing protein n=1 Tax=Nocardia sp. NPDC057455 TaxID=3346138 RepID=UPI003671B38D
MSEIWRATTTHGVIDIEVVRGGSNKRARLTITPERLDVKLGQETDVSFVVAVATHVAEQLKDEPCSFRGDFYRVGDRVDAKMRSTNREHTHRFEYERGDILARTIVEKLPEPVVDPVTSPKIVIPRGWPRSGKTELYAKLRAENPMLARVSRDDTRATLFAEHGVLEYEQEQLISRVERTQAEELLKNGYDVYVDALNLRKKWAEGWADFAVQHGVNYEVIDLDTDVEECVRRDKSSGEAGGRTVGEAAIREIAKRFPRKTWPTITPSSGSGPELVPYVPDESLPPAWICDIDGTLARKAPDRDIYDLTRVHEDIPIAHMVEIIRKLAADSAIVLLSGRDDSSRAVTEQWLRANGIPFTELHMRRAGDLRRDDTVKLELFNAHLRDRFQILGAFDDRLQVCRLWAALNVPLLRLGIPDHDDF